MTVVPAKTHSVIRRARVRSVYWPTRARQTVIATCSDAKPATDWTPSANGSNRMF